MAVLRTADGRIISDREGIAKCWENVFVADLSGHVRTVGVAEAQQEAAALVANFSLQPSRSPRWSMLCRRAGSAGRWARMPSLSSSSAPQVGTACLS